MRRSPSTANPTVVLEAVVGRNLVIDKGTSNRIFVAQSEERRQLGVGRTTFKKAGNGDGIVRIEIHTLLSVKMYGQPIDIGAAPTETKAKQAICSLDLGHPAAVNE